MLIESPRQASPPPSRDNDQRRAGLILATLVTAIFAGATGCAVAAVWYAYLAGGGTLLHPSHGMLRAVGVGVAAVLSMTYCGWATVVRYRSDSDGDDYDDLFP